MPDLKFAQLVNFRCKRCGYDKYDKLMFTGNKFLDDPNVKIIEKYVCRNCDYPIRINDYIKNDDMIIDSRELLNKAKFINENKEETNNE